MSDLRAWLAAQPEPDDVMLQALETDDAVAEMVAADEWNDRGIQDAMSTDDLEIEDYWEGWDRASE